MIMDVYMGTLVRIAVLESLSATSVHTKLAYQLHNHGTKAKKLGERIIIQNTAT